MRFGWRCGTHCFAQTDHGPASALRALQQWRCLKSAFARFRRRSIRLYQQYRSEGDSAGDWTVRITQQTGIVTPRLSGPKSADSVEKVERLSDAENRKRFSRSTTAICVGPIRSPWSFLCGDVVPHIAACKRISNPENFGRHPKDFFQHCLPIAT